MTKQETLPKGEGVAKFDTIKTLRNLLFSRIGVLYYHYSITYHNESILKSKILSILTITVACFFYQISKKIF